MRISDWSSDVCSSDLRSRCADGGPMELALLRGRGPGLVPELPLLHALYQGRVLQGRRARSAPARRFEGRKRALFPHPRDRKSVGEGKSVSVRVGLGGGRYLKKKQRTKNRRHSI